MVEGEHPLSQFRDELHEPSFDFVCEVHVGWYVLRQGVVSGGDQTVSTAQSGAVG